MLKRSEGKGGGRGAETERFEPASKARQKQNGMYTYSSAQQAEH